MTKSKVTLVAVTTVIALVILLGLFLFRWQSEERSPSERAQETASSVSLGVTYLPLTPRVSAYYDLGVDSGALVTEVTSNSPADKAGVKVGDIILSFNGARLEKGVSLLGMMRACPAGNRIVLEVWRGESTRMVEFVHTER